jgi:hypothetical protein
MLLLTSLADDGRPFYNDDLDTLQSELVGAATATFAALGSFILSGCQVTPGVATGTYDIAPGLVWLDVLRQFPGIEGVSLPGFIGVGAAVTSSPRLFETGATKDAYVEYQAGWDSVATPGAIAFTVNNPGLTYWQAAAAQGREIGQVEYVSDTSGYDASGLGFGAKRGWGLCNGQGGRLDLRGQFIAGLDPGQTDYGTVGKTGGAATVQLTADQNGEHSHVINLDLLDSGGQVFNHTTAMYGNPGATNAGKATMEASGLGEAHENRPPYYVLAVRQWVGF